MNVDPQVVQTRCNNEGNGARITGTAAKPEQPMEEGTGEEGSTTEPTYVTIILGNQSSIGFETRFLKDLVKCMDNCVRGHGL